MAVALRSQNDITYASRTNTVIPAPATIVNGDILVIFMAVGLASPPTPSPPAGFTAITHFPVSDTSGGFTVADYCWYKVASSESGSYTVTHTTASTEAWIGSFSGANTSAPIEGSNATSGAVITTSTAATITTLVNGDGVLFLEQDFGDTSNSLTAPTGTTPTFTKEYQSPPGLVFVAFGALSPAGATGAKAMTNNDNASAAWAACLVVIGAAVPTQVPLLKRHSPAQRPVAATGGTF